MAVKPNQSAIRVLGVLEAIAAHQPVGVSELSRILKTDKSAVQRAIMTLSGSGWIHVAPGPSTRWELTPHIFAVAHMSHNRADWRQRAHGVLEDLRDDTGESAILTVPEVRHFVVVDVAESRQPVRTTTTIGTIVPPGESATGRAVLPYCSRERQIQMLGGVPSRELQEIYRQTLDNGYAVSADIYLPGCTNIAAPVFEAGGNPVGAVVITGPSERLNPKQCARIGRQLADTAHSLSRGQPRLPMAGNAERPTRVATISEAR